MSIRAAILPGCTGMGTCTRLAPEVFRIDPATGKAVVLPTDYELHRAAILDAGRACPFVAVEIDGLPMGERVDEVEVIGTQALAPGIIELRLRRPGFRFTPGQYVFLRLGDGADAFFRSYSVVSGAEGEVVLCIRLIPGGRAGAVLSRIGPGARVGLTRAKGLFTLRSPDRPKLFITGGTGIAPVLPMCRAAPEARKRVVVGARRPEDLFWLDRLRAIPNTEVVAVVQEPGPGWDGPVGQVLAALPGLKPEAWPETYVCGSPGMVEAVQRRLVEQGFPPGSVHSDSFLAAGSAPAAPATRRTDWSGLLRRAHFIASAPLALVMLFYALTGFIANRSDLFVGEGGDPPRRQVPVDVPLTREALAPFFAGILPDDAVLAGWNDADPPVATFWAGDSGWRVSASPRDRSVAVAGFGTIPAGVATTSEGLAAELGRHLSGTPDLARAEDDAESLAIDFESVWGTHHATVDKQARTWSATSTQPYLVVSLVDLHRGKHAGAWQRRIVDVTALILALVVVTGMAMGLLAAPRRRMAIGFLLVSTVLLVLLVSSR